MAHVLNIWNSLNWYMQHSGLFIVELIKLPHSTFYMALSHISYSNQCESLELCVWQLVVGSKQLIKTVISNWVRVYGLLHKTEKPMYCKPWEWTGCRNQSCKGKCRPCPDFSILRQRALGTPCVLLPTCFCLQPRGLSFHLCEMKTLD